MFPKIVYPQIILFNKAFHYKPSILGYHYLWKHPYIFGGFKYRISRGACHCGCLGVVYLSLIFQFFGIFGNQRSSRSLPHILANCLGATGSKYIGNWKMRVYYIHIPRNRPSLLPKRLCPLGWVLESLRPMGWTFLGGSK